MSSQSVPLPAQDPRLLTQESRPVQAAQRASGRAQTEGPGSFSQVLRTTTAEPAPSPVRERPGLGRADAPGQRVENHGRIRSAEAHEAASARREARDGGLAELSGPPSDTTPPAATANGSADTPPSPGTAEGATGPDSSTLGSFADAAAAAEANTAEQVAGEKPAEPVDIQTATSAPAAQDATEATEYATDASQAANDPVQVANDAAQAAKDATQVDVAVDDVAAAIDGAAPAQPAVPATTADVAAQQLALAAVIAPAADATPAESTGPGEGQNAPRATPSSRSAAFAGPPGLLKKIADSGDATAEVDAQAAAPGASAFARAVKATSHEAAEAASGGQEIATPEEGAGEKPAAGQEAFKAIVFDLPPPLPTQAAPAQVSGSASVADTPVLSDSLRPGTAQAPPTPLAMLPVEIGMRALEGAQRFEIRLHPEEYGRVDVRLDLDNDGGVKAHLLVDRVDTLAMLQRDAKTLERAFEQAGLKTSDGALQFSLSQGSDQGQREGRQQANTPPPIWQEQAARSDLQAALRSITAPTGAVDIRI